MEKASFDSQKCCCVRNFEADAKCVQQCVQLCVCVSSVEILASQSFTLQTISL
jgi:hypothetical protein